MLKKMIGSMLMIIGTTVGAGMLAMPVVTAAANFQTVLLMMLFSWSIMTIGALALLEVNLWFPSGANLFSMVKHTFGNTARLLTGAIYLLLLYSLLCAYLAGTSDILQGILNSFHLALPRYLTTVIALILLSGVVIKGIHTVDHVNRGLMGLKFLAYFALVFAIAPHISLLHLREGYYTYHTNTLMVIITSFGFANIVPTLRAYLQSDQRKLIQVIVWGSLCAFFIYLIWVITVQGLLPRTGNNGLSAISHSSEPNSLLLTSISVMVHNHLISGFAKIFISICALTSFLGVALSLADFIADGLQCEKRGLDGVKVHALTFLPPLLVVWMAPGIFIKALSYAGFCCVFLLILLPVLMLYRGRYQKSFQQKITILPGGKLLLGIIALIAIALLILQIMEQF